MASRNAHASSSLTRRSLLKAGLAASGVSLLSPLGATVGAAPPTVTPGPAMPPATMPGAAPPPPPGGTPPALAWQAYHGVTGATHQTNFNNLSAQGYRMISLSIYGDPGDPRYAAVWIQRPGNPFIGVHGVTADDYQSRFNDAVAQGFAPVLVSATGLASNARFAAVFEQGVQGTVIARHNMPVDSATNDPNAMIPYFQSMQNQGLTPRAITVYGGFPPINAGGLGVPAEHRWAAVFQQAAPGPTPWILLTGSSGLSVLNATDYQQNFNTLTQQGYRPGALAVTFDQQYAAVFVSAPAVGNWIGRHNLTADQYQQAFNDATAQGLIPLSVQGGGVGDNTRYAAIFAQSVP